MDCERRVTVTRPTRFRLLLAFGLVSALTISETVSADTITPPPLPPPPPASAPATFAATAGNARVSLAWQPVAGASGYRIYRAIDGVWGTTPIATLTGLVYTNGGLTNGTPYSYRVAGYNKGGNGPFSSEASATPMAPPLGFTAAAGDQQIALSWLPSAGALTYTVFRSVSSVETTFVSRDRRRDGQFHRHRPHEWHDVLLPRARTRRRWHERAVGEGVRETGTAAACKRARELRRQGRQRSRHVDVGGGGWCGRLSDFPYVDRHLRSDAHRESHDADVQEHRPHQRNHLFLSRRCQQHGR